MPLIQIHPWSRYLLVIAGPPTHSVGAELVTVSGTCRRRYRL